MNCLAPWHALTIRFNGDIAPDSVYSGKFGNIKEQSLPEILNSECAQNLRRQFLSSGIPNNCQQCITKEKVSGHSRRIFFNQMIGEYASEENYSADLLDIFFLDINMSNVCNLKCRMCSGINSTAWLKEDIKLSENPNFIRPVNHPEFGYNSVSFEMIHELFKYPEYFKNLRYINIKGGEPYLEPANKLILQYLIDLDIAKNVTLDISTNGTVRDPEFDELAQKFGETKWHISIEGTGNLYEYIRGGEHFTFKQLEENLKYFDNMDRVIFAGTVMTYNVRHLDEIKNWYNSIKKSNYELYLSNVVTMPPYLDPSILPEHLLEGTGFESQDRPKDLETFISYTRKLDELRGTNILDVCPEFKELFND